MNIKIKKLTEEIILPTYSTDGSAGLDIFANEDITVSPRGNTTIPLGFALEIPTGYVGLLCPRSSITRHVNIDMPHSFGVIDSDYRGEVSLVYRNTSYPSVRFEKGNKIAQLIIIRIPKCELMLVEELTDTNRCAGGFGSTGN